MSDLRTLIRVEISIDQDWAVGAAPDLWFRPDAQDAAEEDRTTRLPVQRDPEGRVLLPATSLVGSLRRHLGAQAGAWLGSQDRDGTVPSELRCLAAFVPALEKKHVTTTMIDSSRRAAAARTIRREEVLPPTTILWWIEWDHHKPDLALDDLLEQLKRWRPVVGRRRSVNRGRAHVAAVTHRTVDLSTVEGLTWWLGERPALAWSDASPLGEEWTRSATGATADEGQPILTYRFSVQDGLHLGGRTSGNVLETGTTLSSSSWRGIFRSRVAHIVRVSTDGPEDDVNLRVEETLARLFGSGRSRGASEEAGHRGQLRFADSPIGGETQRRTHVAIDRVTGGAVVGSAADPREDSGFLYEVEYLPSGSPLALKVFDDSAKGLSPGDLALLEAVIRDIDDGIVGVGGMTSRGYGTLALEEGTS